MKGKPQMLTNATKSKNAQQGGYFAKEYTRAFEKEPVHDAIRARRQEAITRRKKMVGADYKPPGPVKKNASSGSYSGTFAGQVRTHVHRLAPLLFFFSLPLQCCLHSFLLCLRLCFCFFLSCSQCDGWHQCAACVVLLNAPEWRWHGRTLRRTLLSHVGLFLTDKAGSHISPVVAPRSDQMVFS